MFMKYGDRKRMGTDKRFTSTLHSSKSNNHEFFVCLLIGSVLNIDPLPQASFTTMRWQILIFLVTR